MKNRGHHGRDRMVVGFITTCAISCEFKSHSWRSVLDTTLYDEFCQWFSPGTPISSTNKSDYHDIANTININHQPIVQNQNGIYFLAILKKCLNK
jgi:hypothetical protein